MTIFSPSAFGSKTRYLIDRAAAEQPKKVPLQLTSRPARRLIAFSDTSISKPFRFDLRGETKMASKIALNIKNLVALGTQRLAELLVELSTTNPAVKRRIRLELAGAQSPEEVSEEVRNRLTTIARTRSFVDWRDRKALVADLETQRRAIGETVTKMDPAGAT